MLVKTLLSSGCYCMACGHQLHACAYIAIIAEKKNDHIHTMYILHELTIVDYQVYIACIHGKGVKGQFGSRCCMAIVTV